MKWIGGDWSLSMSGFSLLGFPLGFCLQLQNLLEACQMTVPSCFFSCALSTRLQRSRHSHCLVWGSWFVLTVHRVLHCLVWGSWFALTVHAVLHCLVRGVLVCSHCSRGGQHTSASLFLYSRLARLFWFFLLIAFVTLAMMMIWGIGEEPPSLVSRVDIVYHLYQHFNLTYILRGSISVSFNMY